MTPEKPVECMSSVVSFVSCGLVPKIRRDPLKLVLLCKLTEAISLRFRIESSSWPFSLLFDRAREVTRPLVHVTPCHAAAQQSAGYIDRGIIEDT